MPTRLGVVIPPRFISYVLVSPTSATTVKDQHQLLNSIYLRCAMSFKLTAYSYELPSPFPLF